jgi:hypothetical protein
MVIEEQRPKKKSVSKSNSIKEKFMKKMKTKTGIKYICEWPDCGFSTNVNNYNLLINHMRSHTHKKFECAFPNCGLQFNTCWDLKKHVSTHDSHSRDNNCFNESEDERQLKCCENECEFESKDLHEFRQHLIEHNEEKTFICNHFGCDEKFATIDSLLEHSRTHRPPKKEKKFSCHYDDCNEKFDNFQQLYSHRSQHKGL